jgi:hypothetical protein
MIIVQEPHSVETESAPLGRGIEQRAQKSEVGRMFSALKKAA